MFTLIIVLIISVIVALIIPKVIGIIKAILSLLFRIGVIGVTASIMLYVWNLFPLIAA